MKRVARAIIAGLVVASAGCAQKAAPTEAPAPEAPAEHALDYAGASEVRRGNLAKGRLSDAPMRLKLDIHVLTVPLGAVSRNEEIWKRVNEQAVDIATYDLLIKNGVRVGEAPISEYERFRELVSDQPARSQSGQLVTPEARDVDLDIRKEVDSQTIWYLNGSNELIGRSFDRSQNFLTLSYQPAPRKRGHVRIALCPVVKETRKRLEWSGGNNEMEIAFTQPQRLYDVNLRADVPVNSFLIVAPSGEATWPGSIGNRFFVHDGPAEQLEYVLLLVPRHAPSVME